MGEARLAWEDEVLRATASGALPFTWVENDSVREVFRMLRPAVKLPTCEHLTTVVMDRALAACEAELAADLHMSSPGDAAHPPPAVDPHGMSAALMARVIHIDR